MTIEERFMVAVLRCLVKLLLYGYGRKMSEPTADEAESLADEIEREQS